MFCPKCSKEGRDDAKFCWSCGFNLQANPAGENVSVGGNVGPGAVAGSGNVQAENIAGRDVIGQLLVQTGVSSELELEKVLRERLFTEGVHKNRADVEQWVALYRARGKKPDLIDAKLAGLLLDGIDLTEVDLRRADLSGANLSGAYLREASLSGANLRSAILFEANLSDANLSDAYLDRAILIGAQLHRAKLRRAKLGWADLRRAKLGGVDLTGANLEEAKTPNGRVYRPGMNLSKFGAVGKPKE